MKTYIELGTTNYINEGGIVLCKESPRVEATPENLKKLEFCLANGYAVIKEEKVIDETPIDPPKIEEPINDIHRYTPEELKAMNKKELLELCEKMNLEVKASYKVAKIENIILEAQK